MKNLKLANYMVDPGGKIAKRMVYKDGQVAAFVLNISKGSSMPDHTHFDCTVLIQVLKGAADASVDGQFTAIEAGHLLQVEGHEKVSINNTGNGTLSLYVTLSPNPPSEQYTTDIDI